MTAPIDPEKTPLSIDRIARELDADRRTVAAAIEAAIRLDHIQPADLEGTRGSPRFTLAAVCEAIELHDIRNAKRDMRRWCERYAADLEKALAMPCPRCRGRHVETPILPMPGRSYSPKIAAWHREHSFPARYPEAGPDHRD